MKPFKTWLRTNSKRYMASSTGTTYYEKIKPGLHRFYSLTILIKENWLKDNSIVHQLANIHMYSVQLYCGWFDNIVNNMRYIHIYGCTLYNTYHKPLKFQITPYCSCLFIKLYFNNDVKICRYKIHCYLFENKIEIKDVLFKNHVNFYLNFLKFHLLSWV